MTYIVSATPLNYYKTRKGPAKARP